MLSVLLLVASNTYAVTSHFCGSHLVSVSYIGTTDACGMEMDKEMEACGGETMVKPNCCSEQTQLLESELDQLRMQGELVSHPMQVWVAFVASYLELYTSFQKEYYFPIDDSPPDIERDFQVLFETFLI